MENLESSKKERASFSISATKDDAGQPLLDIEIGEPKEFCLRCSPTQISRKDPYYLKWGDDKILEKKEYKQKMENYIDFLANCSKAIGDGRDMNLEALPASLQNGFQASLDFFLKLWEPERLEINEDDRKLSTEEMTWILKVFKDNKSKVKSISRRTETIDDGYLELINVTDCPSLTFCGTFHEERHPDHSDFSVEKRISKVSCSTFYLFEKDLISIDCVLNILKEWRDGTRKIRTFRYYHTQKDLDWFPLVKDDFKVISEPEPLIWTMNAEVHLHHCAIGREMDDEILDLHYFDDYIQIELRVPPEPLAPVKETPDIFDEDDDAGFGLFE